MLIKQKESIAIPVVSPHYCGTPQSVAQQEDEKVLQKRSCLKKDVGY